MARTEAFNREEILEKVMHLFWKKGYNGTSLQDLVETTGLNRSSLYNSYGNKMQLYRMALDNYMVLSSKQIETSVNQPRTGFEAVKNLFLSFLPEIKNDSRGCMNINCRTEMHHEPSLNSWLKETQEDNLKFFEKLVNMGQQDGSINDKAESREYAWHLLNSLHGYRVTGILEKDEKVLESIITNSLKILK